MSFLVQRFESHNIELAQQALDRIEDCANKALEWFEALSQESKSELGRLEAELKEIKKKVNQWRGILNDVWGNKGKLEQVIKELDEESASISEFLRNIEDLMNRISAKVQESQKTNQEKWENLVKEQNKLHNLKKKVNELQTFLGSARIWFGKIKWEVRAKKKRR